MQHFFIIFLIFMFFTDYLFIEYTKLKEVFSLFNTHLMKGDDDYEN